MPGSAGGATNRIIVIADALGGPRRRSGPGTEPGRRGPGSDAAEDGVTPPSQPHDPRQATTVVTDMVTMTSRWYYSESA